MRGFTHNVGDYSFTLQDGGHVLFTYSTVSGQVQQRLTMPRIAFLAFAAAFVRAEHVQKLDALTTDELLRMKFSSKDMNKASIRVREALESLYHAQKRDPNIDPLSLEYLNEAHGQLERALARIELLETRFV